jgi:UDP-N-acetylglucosamine 3-dehydrogenase
VTGDKRTLRAAVVGLGSMGLNHARVYGEIEGVDLIAVADISPDRQKLAAHGNPTLYDDYNRMLADKRLDLVSVCVPTLLHRDVALAAIQRGVALLVEKPIAATYTEGQAIAKAAQQAAVPLMVGHVERFNPAVLEVKRRLAAGELGRVYQVYARRTGPFPQRVRDVGVVHDLAPHDIDVMFFLLESEVERVYAETLCGISTEHEDMLWGILRFRNGTVGVLDVNWLTPTKVRQLSILGEKGLLQADYLSQQVSFYPKGRDGQSRDTAPQAVRVEIAEPLRLELEAFADAVRRGVAPPVTAEDGLAALETASLLVESAREGYAIDVSQENTVD